MWYKIWINKQPYFSFNHPKFFKFRAILHYTVNSIWMSGFNYSVRIFCIAFGNRRALIKGWWEMKLCFGERWTFPNANISPFLYIRTSWNSCWPRCIRYVQLQPQAGRKIPSKLSIKKSWPAVLMCLLTRSDTRNGGVKMCLCFASWFFDIMLHLLHSGWREKLSCFSRLDNYFSLIPCARPNLSPQ